MAKITVYLPDALASSVKEAGLTVSPICQAALEQEVRRVSAMSAAGSDIMAVVARLKGTSSMVRKDQYAEGFAVGIRWARERASLSELEHMAKLNDISGSGIHVRLDGMHSFPTFLGSLPDDSVPCWREYVESFGPPSPLEIEEQKRTAQGEPVRDYRFERNPWMEGVIAGAFEVYEQVQPHL